MLAVIANWRDSTEAHALLLHDLDVSGSARNSLAMRICPPRSDHGFINILLVVALGPILAM